MAQGLGSGTEGGQVVGLPHQEVDRVERGVAAAWRWVDGDEPSSRVPPSSTLAGSEFAVQHHSARRLGGERSGRTSAAFVQRTRDQVLQVGTSEVVGLS